VSASHSTKDESDMLHHFELVNKVDILDICHPAILLIRGVREASMKTSSLWAKN
jgi:hypothetical protein